MTTFALILVSLLLLYLMSYTSKLYGEYEECKKKIKDLEEQVANSKSKFEILAWHYRKSLKVIDLLKAKTINKK